jgi:hypothetical protein
VNPDTLYQIWELNSNLKYSVDHPGVGDYTDLPELLRFWRRHETFLLTDWKKSGLTLPHWYIKLLIKVLQKKNHNYSGRFPTDGIRIYDPKKKKWFINSSFGYGLGMVNNAYTVFNIALFEYGRDQGLFSEKDEILSFNDDSAIGCEEISYHRWLGICQDSGGYLDVHKSVQSKSVQFCELHAGNIWNNSFKWISTFNTLLCQMVEAVNKTHWRFLITDTWDAINNYNFQVTPRIPNAVFLGTIEHYILLHAQSYFGTEFINGLNPEFGGIGVGNKFRTPYSLKNTLLVLEKSTGKDFYYRAQCLLECKESERESNTPEYKPWDKFPEGNTKSRMIEIGKLHGINHELESLLSRACNKFALDNKWVNQRKWEILDEKLSKINYDNPYICDVWDAIAKYRWPAHAVPKILVTSEVQMDQDIVVLPFARIQKEAARYSLPTMLEAFYKYHTGEKPGIVPIEELSMKGYLLWETPVFPDRDYYHPICDMELISKIADFCDPRRVFLDYWSRNSSVITGLRTEDHRGKATANFLATITGKPILAAYKATWYTQYILPYDEDLEKILSRHLPTSHEEIIASWFLNQDFHKELIDADLPFDFIDRDKRENPKFWRNRIKSKKRSERKKRASKSNVAPAPIIHGEALSEINMDDISQLMDRYQETFRPKRELELVEERVIRPILSLELPDMETPDWLLNPVSPPTEEVDEEQWNDSSEDEDEMIRLALDLACGDQSNSTDFDLDGS